MQGRLTALPYDYSKLQGKIREIFKTQDRFAEKLGMARTVLYSRLNGSTEWKQSEMEKTMLLFGEPLTSIGSYFFVCKVRETEQ